MKAVTATRTPSELARAVKQAIASVDALEKGLGITAPKLSGASKRHTVRYRKGAGPIIGTIGNVARQHGVEFPRSPVKEMTDQLELAAALEGLRLRIVTLESYLSNVIFSAQSGAWSTALEYYALLRRMSRRNREIAAAIEPVTKFLSVHDPRRKREPGEPTRAVERKVKQAVKQLQRTAPEQLAVPVPPKKK